MAGALGDACLSQSTAAKGPSHRLPRKIQSPKETGLGKCGAIQS